MNVLFSSDNNYAQHLGVAIYSLLQHNQLVEKINIYVIDNEISLQNREKLNLVISSFKNAFMVYIPFGQWKDKLRLNLCWDISLSSYARLFLASMLPDDTERVIYMDCDMIVCENLADLWDYDLSGNVIGAVQDTVSDPKIKIGLSLNDAYFNAGMLLVDLNMWRKQGCERKCLSFIEKYNGTVAHHDQGVLNGVFRHQWTRLPLKYNVMTIHYLFTQKTIKKMTKDASSFYSEEEVFCTLSDPSIIHFTPSMTTRPWVRNCKHPLKNLYWNIIIKTPWQRAKPERDKSKWYVRVINWWLRIAYS